MKTINSKENFIFIDNEGTQNVVLWDPNEFEKIYTELQNEYWKTEKSYEDFYDVLEERLKNVWIEIYVNPTIIYHDNLSFSIID